VGYTEGKIALGRTRRRWDGVVNMDCNEVGWEGMNWRRLLQDRDKGWDFVNTVMNVWVP
jgi:hypothetical protein